jgi:isopentenyl diphosphate isomerase/L-lactate dehydrogenase-like FMN-dependent dehydrogenase
LEGTVPPRWRLPTRDTLPPRKQFKSWEEARALARRRLPGPLFENMMFGVGRGVTSRWNTEAYDQIAFRPRAAMSFDQRQLRTTVLGTEISMPLFLDPVGAIRLVHPDGACAAARAAHSADTLCAVSMVAGHGVAEVAQASSGPLWQQLYLTRGREAAEQVIQEAADCGYKALVITVDCPVPPKPPVPITVSLASALRFAPDIATHPGWATGFFLDGLQLGAANEAMAPRTRAAVWSDLEWIRPAWRGPLVVKGVVTADDARRAVDGGADCVVISNHGGLALDGAPATLPALPGVVEAVGSQAEVLIDGGIRQGSDVIKALALGARAVMIGRPYVAGLAIGGEAGVRQTLEMFRHQIDTALAMVGCDDVHALDPSYVTVPRHWNVPEKWRN